MFYIRQEKYSDRRSRNNVYYKGLHVHIYERMPLTVTHSKFYHRFLSRQVNACVR